MNVHVMERHLDEVNAFQVLIAAIVPAIICWDEIRGVNVSNISR